MWRLVRSISPIYALMAVLGLFAAVSAFAQDSQWVRPEKPGDPLVWGRRDGIVFGLNSKGGIKGPRGLIRVGVFTPESKEPQLLNYIAVEPVTRGPSARIDRMAFSELEKSELDPGEQGKRMWVDSGVESSVSSMRGTLETFHEGDATVERLSVRIDVEKFTANGADVYLVASIDSDQPEEICISTFAQSDSAPLEELTLSATMGNYERLRLLWLKDRVENSRTLFAAYGGEDFAEKQAYPLNRMLRNDDGDAIVFSTSDEASPRDTPANKSAHWKYTLPKLTQYWRVPGYDVQPDLRVRVNGRRVYWASHAPVPGGIAFENFEVRQRFVPGQVFIFGITRQEPWIFDPRLTKLRLKTSTSKAGSK